AGDDGGRLFGEEGEGEEGDEHDRREEEERNEGVGGSGMPEQEDLGKGPAEAGEEGGAHGESKPKGVECSFAVDHEQDSHGHGEDDGDKFDRGRFEAEEECESKDEYKDGGFTHRIEC
ncbi:MAG: hypothetical protein M1823_009177, partial [Watsoniomyces obsoletus]